jgi:hypothetical protein
MLTCGKENKLEFIKDLPASHATQALYRKGDEFILVSTLTHKQKMNKTPAQRGLLELVDTLAAVFGVDPYPAFGEETMAFRADAEGNMVSPSELAKSFGDGSRERVIAQLSDT